MAEQLVNEFTVNRPIEEAWPIITDVEKIAPCMPGAELQEIRQDDEKGEVYSGVVKVKLGAISTQFKGDAFFVERDDENYKAVINGKGRDTGGRGNAAADITATAESLSPTSTKVNVTTDLQISGKVAQFGRGILGDVSSKLIGQFADNLNEMIDQDGVGDSGSGDATSDDETADSSDATAPAKAATTGSDATSSSTTTADTSGSDDRVRKINGPAAEPIDLMDVSGTSVLKRAAPAVLALLAILFFLRRRS